ncbi:MAG TPA: anti-sigma factor [Trueperaceae bacterium]
MSHPQDLLPDYALGTLGAEERARVEAHLEDCEACRTEVRRTSESLVRLVEALPEAPPPPGAWDAIQARLPAASSEVPAGVSQGPTRRPARSSWRGWAALAALVLVLAGGWWGFGEVRQVERLRAEQQQVARWLAQPQVERMPLLDKAGDKLGGLLMLPDGRALFVLQHPPAAGRAYQAWGHKGDRLVSLGVFERPVFEVPYEDYEALYLSLEPEAGSGRPTHGLAAVDL